MFGAPEPAPRTGNILLLIWSYFIKLDGTRKALHIVNGSPHSKVSIALGRTCTTALEQSGEQLFWALSTINNYVVTEAYTSNMFAKAEPPEAQSHVLVDNIFANGGRKKKVTLKSHLNTSWKWIIPSRDIWKALDHGARNWWCPAQTRFQKYN